jgi:hypothetical protein
VLGAVCVAGCASPAGPGSHAGETYVVNAQHTPFYTFGPAQAGGPDFALSHGQRVTMLSRDYGYSHVAIEGTGQAGYVSTDDLIPAPPKAASLASALPSPAIRRRAPRQTGDYGVEPGAPLPEFPDAKPPPGSPSFRY